MCRFLLWTSGKYSESIWGEFPRLRFSVCINRPGLQVAEASGQRRPRKGCLCFRKPTPPDAKQNRNSLGREDWDVIEHQSWCIVGVLGRIMLTPGCMWDWLDGSVNDAKKVVAFCRDKLSFGPKTIKSTSASYTSAMEMTVVFWGSPLNLECNGNLERPLHVVMISTFKNEWFAFSLMRNISETFAELCQTINCHRIIYDKVLAIKERSWFSAFFAL